MSHDIEIKTRPGTRSLPAIFAATCSCGEQFGPNAFKWVVLNIQRHYVEAGLAQHKNVGGYGGGLVVDAIAGDGLGGAR